MATIVGAWHVVAAFLGSMGVLAVWFVLIIVIPGTIAIYIGRIFPLTGQWRKRWRGRGPL